MDATGCSEKSEIPIKINPVEISNVYSLKHNVNWNYIDIHPLFNIACIMISQNSIDLSALGAQES